MRQTKPLDRENLSYFNQLYLCAYLAIETQAYEEVLEKSVSDFQDDETYHTAMFTAATKMAKILIGVNEGQMAKKYVEIANKHGEYYKRRN